MPRWSDTENNLAILHRKAAWGATYGHTPSFDYVWIIQGVDALGR